MADIGTLLLVPTHPKNVAHDNIYIVSVNHKNMVIIVKSLQEPPTKGVLLC